MKTFILAVLFLSSVPLVFAQSTQPTQAWDYFVGCYQAIDFGATQPIPESDRITTEFSVGTDPDLSCMSENQTCKLLKMDYGTRQLGTANSPAAVLNQQTVYYDNTREFQSSYRGPVYNWDTSFYARNFAQEVSLIESDDSQGNKLVSLIVLQSTDEDSGNTTSWTATLLRVPCK